MSTVRIVHKIEGYHQLRSEPGVRAKLESMGRRVLAAAGGESAGYRMDSRQGRSAPQGRWRVSVAAVSYAAKLDNARHNTLLRAMGAAGS